MMFTSITAAGLMAIGAAAQANNAIPGYEYYGCVAVPDLTPVRSFNPEVEGLSPITCQKACPENTDMVFVGAGCHCVASPMNGWYKIPEAKCSAECGKAVDHGFCGGGAEYDAERNIFIIPHNLYLKAAEASAIAAQMPVATPIVVATPATPVDYTSPVPTPNNGTGPYCPKNTNQAGAGAGASASVGSGSGSGSGCASGTKNCPYVSAGFGTVAGRGVMAAAGGSVLALLLASL